MKIKKKDLIEVCKSFLFEKSQNISKEYIDNIDKETAVRHKETGIEYTVDDNDPEEEGNITIYRHDIEEPETKIYDQVNHDQFSKDYKLV